MVSGNKPITGKLVTDEQLDGSTLGRYRLIKKIARGGMAEVFVARSFGAHGFEKTVAIKRILPRYADDPQFLRMMVDEAKITVLLNHPNVATILELCELEGDYFIVMEFVPGTSLQAMRKRLAEKATRLADLDACFIVMEVLQGLQAAHVQRDNLGNPARIIHRDVSPQNVLVRFDGHVKVIDFGIARARDRLEMTEVGTIKGKLRYLAPEMIDPVRFMKTGDFDHRVDVFAAGIVLWELIAGRTLYQGDDEMKVYDAITETDAPDLHAIGLCDAELSTIVKHALARDPQQRFASAEAFADELRTYVYKREPGFTHKRIAAMLAQHFAAEALEMEAFERGGTGAGSASPPAPGLSALAAAGAASAPPLAPASPPPSAKRDAPQAARAAQSPITPDGATRTHIGADPTQPAKGGEPGDVLTVMTLVSRRSNARLKPAAERAADFQLAGDTATATQANTVVDDKAPAVKDETPHTSERFETRGGARPTKRRAVLWSAVAGLFLALGAAVMMQRDAPVDDDAALRPAVRDAGVLRRVGVRVTCSPLATASVAGDKRLCPAEFLAAPGDVLSVVVAGPGYVEQVKRVQVAPDQVESISMDVRLAALDAGVAVDVVADVPTVPVPVSRPYSHAVRVDKRVGTLKITSKPYWGSVTVDGKTYDEVTPMTIDLPFGKHRLVVTHPPKGLKRERTITIRSDTQLESIDFE